MSRFSESAEWDDPLEMGRAMRNWQVCVTSKRGQAALRRLEAALLALPRPRLIEGHLATAEGDVCAVGAYVAFRDGPEQMGEHIEELATYDAAVEESGDDLAGVTISEGQGAGLTATLACRLADFNDESCYGDTPERRYERMLAWVRRNLQ